MKIKTSMRSLMLRVSLMLTLSLGLPWISAGQLSDVVLAGYGSSSWSAMLDDDFRNDFSASVSPVLLYSIGEDFLFESELEFGLHGESTTTGLEYAQVDYLGFERVIITTGKFLVPFGLFGERTHPSWINKLPQTPLLYGHAHGGVAEGALMPILADAGVLIRYKRSISETMDVALSGWVTQGPMLVEHEDDAGDGHQDDGHDHQPAPEGATVARSMSAAAEAELTPIAYGVAFSDNNANKMVGARLGVLRGAGFEVYVSAFHARPDVDNELDLVGLNGAFRMQVRDLDIRGEFTQLTRDMTLDGQVTSVSEAGYFTQVSKRMGRWEPIVQWNELLRVEEDHHVLREDVQMAFLGLNYWFQPSIVLKAAYQVNPDETNGLYVQWAFGF